MKRNLTLREFETTYDLYKGTVYGIAAAMLKNQKNAVAVTEEVFTEIIFEGYLYKKNELERELYKKTCEKCNAVLAGEITPSDWTAVWDKSVEETPEENVAFAVDDELLKLFPHLTELDVKQRAVLILSAAKLDMQSISDIVGIPLQTVEWMQSQNKKELKDAGVQSYGKYLKEMTEVLSANEPSLKLKLSDAYSDEFSHEESTPFPWKPVLIASAVAIAVIAAVVYTLLR